MIVPTGWRSFPSLFLLSALLSASLLAQEQPLNLDKRATSSTDLVIRRTVRRVVVDVIVLDKDGNAVKGLDQDDFSLKEDGKQQRLLSFDIHDGSKPDYVPPKIPPLPPNTFVDVPKEPEQGPLYVILYDMVNMDLNDQASSRKPLLNFIDSRPPGTRFAIFLNTDQTSLLQGFTQDRELLHAALTSQGPGPHIPRMFLHGANYGTGNSGATVSLFNQLAKYLDGIPGRKNLLWLVGNFPLTLFATDDSIIPEDEVKQTIATMARSQISIYPIDVRGVVISDEATSSGSAVAAGAGRGAGGIGAPGGGGGPSGGGIAGQYMSLDEIAEETGGHAYYSSNHVGELLDKALNQGSSFYTVSYSPTNYNDDGGARKIEVKLAKSGYHLEYRRFYYALAPDAQTAAEKKDSSPMAAYRAAAKQNDTLYGSIEHGAPMMHDLLFSSHVRVAGKPALATPQQMMQIQDEPAYFRTRRRNRPTKPIPPIKLQKYLVDYLVIDQQLKTMAAQTGRPAMLEFAAAAYDNQGRMLNGIVNDATAAAPKPGDQEGALFRVEQELNIPLEGAWLRVAVRDTVTDRTGTLEIPLPLKAVPAEVAAAH